MADSADAGIDVQTHEVLAKIDAPLKAGGSDKSRLLMVNVYLPNMLDFAAMNVVYDTWVDKANLPARATVETRLADPSLRVEISAIAAAGE